MKFSAIPSISLYKFILLFYFAHTGLTNSYSLSRIDSIPKKVYERVDRAPNFPGGATGWLSFLKKNQKLPTVVLEGKVHGSVVIRFIVDETGALHKPVVTEKPLGDFETMEEAIRLYNLMPKWIPAILGGEKVSAYGSIEVPFGDGEIDMIVEEAPTPLFESHNEPSPATNSTEIFQSVGTMPVYAGGSVALLRFIEKNLKYPAIAKTNGIHGIVVVQMIVEKDGSLSNLKIVKGLDGGCNEEALRLVKSMPKWTPGTNQKGVPTPVSFILPIRFKLE